MYVVSGNNWTNNFIHQLTLSFDKVILEDQPVLLDPSSVQDPWDSSKQNLEWAKVCFPDI